MPDTGIIPARCFFKAHLKSLGHAAVPRGFGYSFTMFIKPPILHASHRYAGILGRVNCDQFAMFACRLCCDDLLISGVTIRTGVTLLTFPILFFGICVCVEYRCSSLSADAGQIITVCFTFGAHVRQLPPLSPG